MRMILFSLFLFPIQLFAAEPGLADGKYLGAIVNTRQDMAAIARLYVTAGETGMKLTMDIPHRQRFDIALETVSYDGDTLVFKRRDPMGTILYRGRLEGDRLLGSYEAGGMTWGTFSFTRTDSSVIKGARVPAFAVDLMDGGRLTDRDLAGKLVLIDFWGTRCPSCVQEMGSLHRVYERYKDHLTILSLSMDETAEDVAAFRKGKWPMPWLNGHLPGRFQDKVARRFEVFMTPAPYLIAPDGTILAKGEDLVGEQLARTLARLVDRGGER